MSIAHIRKEYSLAGLRRADLLPDPIQQFVKWLNEAIQAEVLEPTAMTLATSGGAMGLSARTVLLKAVDDRGFTFFTNYESRKGQDLKINPQAALVFHWKELERQVCITGSVSPTSRKEAEDYFQSRPVGSRLAAWVSKQTEVIANREVLEERLKTISAKYGTDVPLPPFWGGFSVAPLTLEFWQGRPNRLHDRLLYSFKEGGWLIERLSP